MSANDIGCVKDNCCACGVCEAVCPKNAIIKVKRDRAAVCYTSTEECSHCGQCAKVCPMLQINYFEEQDRFYKAISYDDEVLKRASSGGIAYEVSRYFIENGGVVYASAWSTENQRVEHIRIDTMYGLKKSQGSKYVQSIIDIKIFQSIIFDLKSRNVLFIGCPCQVGAVKNYSHNNDRLYTIDLICHGVPSPALLSEQLNYITKEEVSELSFRDRQKFRLTVKSNKVDYIADGYENPYYSLFLNYASFRESCYSCKYSKNVRTGDLTVGDYAENGNGYSCVLCSSTKGKELLDVISDRVLLEQRDISCLHANEAFWKPTAKSKKVESFTYFYEKYGLRRAYYKVFYKLAIKKYIAKIVGPKIYIGIKRMFGKNVNL